MSPASDPSASSHLPPHTVRGGAGGLSSPWAQVVRGEPEAVPAAPSSTPPPAPISSSEAYDRSPSPVENAASSAAAMAAEAPPSESVDHGNNGNAAVAAPRGKKLAWNMPPNGSNGSNEAGPVMGADSWPPLSESTRVSTKSSSSDTLKALSDGSFSASPGSPITSPLLKPSSNHQNPNTTPNHAGPVRQKSNPNPNSMRRGDGGGGSSSGSSVNGGSPPPLAPPASPEASQIIPEKQSGPEPSPKDHPNKRNSNWDHGWRSGGLTPQSHGAGDHHRGYGSSRRASSGGGGSHHGGYGSRRDHERGGYVWNPPRGFSGRDAHMPLPPPPLQRAHPRPFPRPPSPASAQFISPLQVRPFMSPIGFVDFPPMYYLPALPPNMLVAHQVPSAIPPTMFAPVDYLRTMLLKQIEYYFSSENLCKDIYLRQKMDDQGWVPISLIAGFNRVKQLTNDIQYILDTVRGSDIVEVQGKKIRRHNDWMNWILRAPPNQYSTSSGSSSPATPNYDSLAARMHDVGLGEGAANHDSMRGQTHTEVVVLSRSPSGNLNNQSQVGEPDGEENVQLATENQIDLKSMRS